VVDRNRDPAGFEREVERTPGFKGSERRQSDRRTSQERVPGFLNRRKRSGRRESDALCFAHNPEGHGVCMKIKGHEGPHSAPQSVNGTQTTRQWA